MFAPVTVWIRAQLRRQKPAVFGLAALAALAALVPLLASAGAVRTATSLERMREELRPSQLDVQFNNDAPPAGAVERLASLPGVADVGQTASILARPRGSQLDQLENYGVGGLDEGLGRDFNRPRLSAGRRAAAADEALISPRLAAELNLGVGDTLVLETYTEDDVETIFAGSPAGYGGPEVSLRVVGVGRSPEELTAGDDAPSALFVLAPAFFEEWAGRLHFFDAIFTVRLTGGPGGISSFEQAARAEFPDRDDLNFHISEENARIDDAISTQTIALALLALAAMVSGALALAQAATRFARSSSAEQHILSVLGLNGRVIACGRIGVTAVPIVAGVLTAVGVASGASGLFPTGPAGRLEPDPGIRVEGPVLALVSILLLGVALTVTAVFGRGRPGRAPARSSALVRLIARPTSLVATSVGIRSALQVDRGPRALPVRSAMVACGAGLAGVVAALVFATSLDRLVDDPVRYGWTWDFEAALGDQLSDEQAQAQARPIVTDAQLQGALYARVATKAIGGKDVLTLGVETFGADVAPTIVHGRNVRADDEIVLGRTTLDQMGKQIGESVEVEGPEGSVKLGIVGQGLFPIIESADPAVGAIVTLAAMDRLPGSDGYPTLYVRLAPGADGLALRRDLEDQGIVVTEPVAPPVVANLGQVDKAPYLLAGYLGLLAAAATAHALLTAIRRRRRELAVLTAVGFVRPQVAATVITQAVTFAVVGLIAGLPLGVVLGRWAWRLTAGRLGFADDAVIPLLALLLIAPVAIGAAVVIASVPAWWAARARPAAILRSE